MTRARPSDVRSADASAGPRGHDVAMAAQGCTPAARRRPLPIPLPTEAAGVRQPLWMAQYRIALVTLDVSAIIVAIVVAYVVRFVSTSQPQSTADYLLVGLGITLGWTVALQYCGGYDLRHLASGPEEAKRVLRASAMTVGILAVFCYAFKFSLARGFVIGAIPLGVVLLLVERAVVRRVVSRRRERGDWAHRILAVGTAESVAHLIQSTERARGAGLQVVGACVEDAPREGHIGASEVPVLGGVFDAAEIAESINADVVAVAGSGLGPTGVRELGWRLEGTGRGLVMAPALTEIAGTRMRVSPVEGLPLVWLDQPQLGRLPRLIKRVMDVLGGGALLLLAGPILLASAAAIKMTSRGPVFFRQRRLGVNGSEFSILKFRTMHVGSEARRAEILELNEQDGAGVLFKIRQDPRVTSVGRWLRKFSIDELPQLVHVVSGTMSLVGPRPLAAEDSIYTGSARRRLLVRPGLTGLWQISGRSDMSWDDAVRLDLYYVENWSIGVDVSILFRTIFAVLGRRGAY